MTDKLHEEERESLKEQFKDQHKELTLPAHIDKDKVENLRENRQKTIEKINDMMKHGAGKKQSTEKMMFSFHVPEKEPDRKIGDKWFDKDGFEWEQREGYKIKLPKIDIENVRMPLGCPGCGGGFSHWLDKKFWYIHGVCFNCVTKLENELREQGLYKEYEKKKIMANIRAFYRDAVNGMEDMIVSFDATYVDATGRIEKWTKPDRVVLRAIVQNDLNKLQESFQKEFGEPLEGTKNGQNQ